MLWVPSEIRFSRCGWSFGFYLLVQVAYNLFQGVVIGSIGTLEGELTEGVFFSGVAKAFVAFTSIIYLYYM